MATSISGMSCEARQQLDAPSSGIAFRCQLEFYFLIVRS